MKNVKGINVKVPEDVKKEFERYCDYKFQTISENLREHIRKELKEWERIKIEKGIK